LSTYQNEHEQQQLFFAIGRNRLLFGLLVGTLVLVCAFSYGLVSGLKRTGVLAHASGKLGTQASGLVGLARGHHVFPTERPSLLTAIFADVGGVKYQSIGNDVRINGAPAESFDLFSRRSVKSLLAEYKEVLFRKGFSTNGLATKKRGVLLAWDGERKTRIAITAWLKPPGQRGEDGAVAGQMSVMFTGSGERAGLPGEIPGIPPLPGGKKGAVFSSVDQGGRSYTVSYTNPGDLGQSLAFYREVLSGSGWELVENFDEVETTGSLRFRRLDEEALLLFSQLTDARQTQAVVTVYAAGSVF